MWSERFLSTAQGSYRNSVASYHISSGLNYCLLQSMVLFNFNSWFSCLSTYIINYHYIRSAWDLWLERAINRESTKILFVFYSNFFIPRKWEHLHFKHYATVFSRDSWSGWHVYFHRWWVSLCQSVINFNAVKTVEYSWSILPRWKQYVILYFYY